MFDCDEDDDNFFLGTVFNKKIVVKNATQYGNTIKGKMMGDKASIECKNKTDSANFLVEVFTEEENEICYLVGENKNMTIEQVVDYVEEFIKNEKGENK